MQANLLVLGPLMSAAPTLKDFDVAAIGAAIQTAAKSKQVVDIGSKDRV